MKLFKNSKRNRGMKIFQSIDPLFGVRSRATDDKKGEEWQKKIMTQVFFEFLNSFNKIKS